MRLFGTAGTLELLHNATSKRLEVGGLVTDGEAVFIRRTLQGEMTLCTVGGNAAEVALASQPDQVKTLDGKILPPGETWEWREDRLAIRNMGDVWCVKTR